MARRRTGSRLDPKHVRDYFHRYALFTRVFHLCADGVWWLICRGSVGLAKSAFSWMPRWPRRFPVNERLRRRHTFVVGRTGAGKSVLLHHHLRHYLTRDLSLSAVLLDPHGDLARMVVRDRALLRQDRLVLVDFTGLQGRHIHLNPFDLNQPNEESLNHAQLQFAAALEQIFGEPFTPRQRTLVRACLAVVLHAERATLVELLRLLQDGQNRDLVRYGQTQLPNVVDRQFFRGSFADPLYVASKLALISRLTDVVRDPVVRRFTCQRSSFDLGQLLDGGRVLVVQFDPARQGRGTIRTLGQLLTAAILSHVLGRPVNRRRGIHLFSDECQYFIGPGIAEVLGEGRKFGLYATLATQRLDALGSDLQDAILGNVGNLWVGGSRHHTAERMAKETGLATDTIRHLRNLHFWHAAHGQPNRAHHLAYLGQRYAMHPAQWAQLQKQQADRYYRAPSKGAPLINGAPEAITFAPDSL